MQRTGGPKISASGKSSGDRLLLVLGLFTVDQPQWTVDDAAKQLGVSGPTAYRYFKRLTNSGLISPVSGASYVLGPAIIQMDRQIQICDPMLRAARGVMHTLIARAGAGAALLLCRLFHDGVMCVNQVLGQGPQAPVSYERGRMMPLFRGATSKIILAHLPTRKLKPLFARSAAEIAQAGLGKNWEQFRSSLASIRRSGTVVTHGEIDLDRVGIGAPLFDRNGKVLGSLSFALSAGRTSYVLIERLTPLLITGARDIEHLMNDEPASQISPARLRVAR